MESIDAQIFMPYPYQRLSSEDCICLIYVKPFLRRRNTVQCEIKQFPSQKRTPFEALSYEWGVEIIGKTRDLLRGSREPNFQRQRRYQVLFAPAVSE